MIPSVLTSRTRRAPHTCDLFARLDFFTEQQRSYRAQIEVDRRPLFLPDLEFDPAALDGPDAIRQRRRRNLATPCLLASKYDFG